MSTPQILYHGASQDLELLRVPGSTTLVLGGDLVLLALGDAPQVGDAYLPMQPRSTSLQLLRSSKSMLHIYVRKEALTARTGGRKVLAVEAIMRWLRTQAKTEEFLLVAGVPSKYETLVQIFHVRQRSLVSIDERRLPAVTEPHYRGDMLSSLERIRQQHPQVPVFWGLPNMECPEKDIPDVSATIYKSVSRMPKLPTIPREAPLLKFLPGILAAALGLAGYAGAIGVPYLSYLKAQEEFRAESRNMSAGVSYTAELLTLLNEQQAFLADAQGRADKLEQFSQLLRRTVSANAPMREAQLQMVKDPTDPKAKSDFTLKVVVPADLSTTALEQSRPLADSLSARAGSPLWLAADGITDDSSTNKKAVREYRLEGDLSVKPKN